MPATRPRRLPSLGWLLLIAAAAIGPAWLMPPPRAVPVAVAEVRLPELHDPDAVTEDGIYVAAVAPVTPRPTPPPAAVPADIEAVTPPKPTVDSIPPAVRELGTLSLVYWKQPERRDAIDRRLTTLASQVFLAPQPHVIKPHRLAEGERLIDVAQRYGVSWRYLERLNRVEARRLRLGQELKVMRGPFDAIAEKSRFRLTVHTNGYVVAHFPIAIGRQDRTPAGTFAVDTKVTNPAWHGPDRVVAADDPSNPLGERWIGLTATGDTPPVSGLGLHSTTNPGSIGTAASNGCLRLRPADAELVFDLLTPGSVVEIRE